MSSYSRIGWRRRFPIRLRHYKHSPREWDPPWVCVLKCKSVASHSGSKPTVERLWTSQKWISLQKPNRNPTQPRYGIWNHNHQFPKSQNQSMPWCIPPCREWELLAINLQVYRGTTEFIWINQDSFTDAISLSNIFNQYSLVFAGCLDIFIIIISL